MPSESTGGSSVSFQFLGCNVRPRNSGGGVGICIFSLSSALRGHENCSGGRERWDDGGRCQVPLWENWGEGSSTLESPGGLDRKLGGHRSRGGKSHESICGALVVSHVCATCSTCVVAFASPLSEGASCPPRRDRSAGREQLGRLLRATLLGTR